MIVTSWRGIVPLCAVLALAAACGSSSGKPTPEPRPNVTNEDLRNPNESLELALQRKVPGLIVKSTADGVVIQVRDLSSANNADRTPLYVVDGLPIRPGPGGTLPGINIDDIESVRVLRGAESVIYGTDGLNGVILITTKRGPDRKKP